MKKKKINKVMKFEKFLVCPNCKRPLCRKRALKVKGLRTRYCDRCGFDYTDMIKHTPAGKTKKKDTDFGGKWYLSGQQQFEKLMKEHLQSRERMRFVGGGKTSIDEKKLEEIVNEIALKYAKLVNDRIDKAEKGLTGEDLREIYDGIQMLGHVTATMERLSRMGNPATTQSYELS